MGSRRRPSPTEKQRAASTPTRRRARVKERRTVSAGRCIGFISIVAGARTQSEKVRRFRQQNMSNYLPHVINMVHRIPLFRLVEILPTLRLKLESSKVSPTDVPTWWFNPSPNVSPSPNQNWTVMKLPGRKTRASWLAHRNVLSDTSIF